MVEPGRDGETSGAWSGRLLGEDGWEKLILFGFVFFATVIAGAASTGAGIAILVTGLLATSTLGFVRWRNAEVKAGMRTGWELLETAARRPRPRISAPPQETAALGRPDPSVKAQSRRRVVETEAPPAGLNGGGGEGPSAASGMGDAARA